MISYNGFEQNPDDTYAMWTPAHLRQVSAAKNLRKEMDGFEYIAVRLDGGKPTLVYFTHLQKVEPGTTPTSPYGTDGGKLLTLTGKEFLLIHRPDHDASAKNDLREILRVKDILATFGVEDKSGEKRTAIVKFVSDLRTLLQEIAARPKQEEPVTIVPAAREVAQQPPAAAPFTPPSRPVELTRATPPASPAFRRREPLLGHNEPSLSDREPSAVPLPSRQAAPVATRASTSVDEERMPDEIFEAADKGYKELFDRMGRPKPRQRNSNDSGPKQ